MHTIQAKSFLPSPVIYSYFYSSHFELPISALKGGFGLASFALMLQNIFHLTSEDYEKQICPNGMKAAQEFMQNNFSVTEKIKNLFSSNCTAQISDFATELYYENRTAYDNFITYPNANTSSEVAKTINVAYTLLSLQFTSKSVLFGTLGENPTTLLSLIDTLNCVTNNKAAYCLGGKYVSVDEVVNLLNRFSSDQEIVENLQNIFNQNPNLYTEIADKIFSALCDNEAKFFSGLSKDYENKVFTPKIRQALLKLISAFNQFDLYISSKLVRDVDGMSFKFSFLPWMDLPYSGSWVSSSRLDIWEKQPTEYISHLLNLDTISSLLNADNDDSKSRRFVNTLIQIALCKGYEQLLQEILSDARLAFKIDYTQVSWTFEVRDGDKVALPPENLRDLLKIIMKSPVVKMLYESSITLDPQEQAKVREEYESFLRALKDNSDIYNSILPQEVMSSKSVS